MVLVSSIFQFDFLGNNHTVSMFLKHPWATWLRCCHPFCCLTRSSLIVQESATSDCWGSFGFSHETYDTHHKRSQKHQMWLIDFMYSSKIPVWMGKAISEVGEQCRYDADKGRTAEVSGDLRSNLKRTQSVHVSKRKPRNSLAMSPPLTDRISVSYRLEAPIRYLDLTIFSASRTLIPLNPIYVDLCMSAF